MSVRKLLAANFARLRRENPKLNDFGDIVAAGEPSNGTLGRIMKMDTGVSIDMVGQLAGVYGIQAWQLLAPQGLPLSMHELPVTRSMSKEALQGAEAIDWLPEQQDRAQVASQITLAVLALIRGDHSADGDDLLPPIPPKGKPVPGGRPKKPRV